MKEREKGVNKKCMEERWGCLWGTFSHSSWKWGGEREREREMYCVSSGRDEYWSGGMIFKTKFPPTTTDGSTVWAIHLPFVASSLLYNPATRYTTPLTTPVPLVLLVIPLFHQQRNCQGRKLILRSFTILN